jgi:hypothetical protein
MDAVDAIETERAAFEQWARKEWNSLTVEKRAARFARANERVKEHPYNDDPDLGLVLLAGGAHPL